MRWLAVCSNGAVSLGAYEAGVLAQLYADVCAVNKNGPIVGIDAIAGASAGAVAGTLLAQAIVTESSPTDLTNRLVAVWVSGLGIDALLGDTGNAAESLFDPSTLTKLSGRILLTDAAVRQMCEGKVVPTVTFSIALTNVDGIPYRIALTGTDVVASLNADYETYVIEGGVPYVTPGVDTLKADTPDKGVASSWSKVKDVAITSGSFPFAFKSEILERDLSHYAKAVYPPGEPHQSFDYTDGGVMDNQPLGRAIDAATFEEKLHGHRGDRTFLIIDPDPSTEASALDAMAELQANLKTKKAANGLPLLGLGGRIVNAYFNTGLHRDLDQALTINNQLEALSNLVKAGEITEDQSKQVRAAVGLDFKRPIEIERIPGLVVKDRLAGAFAGHFGGFFDQRYRSSDFAVGCYEARTWFKAWIDGTVVNLLNPNLESGKPASERPTPPPNGGFKGLEARSFSGAKDKIADRLETLSKHLLQSSSGWAVVEEPLFAIERKIIRHELDDFLKDDPEPDSKAEPA